MCYFVSLLYMFISYCISFCFDTDFVFIEVVVFSFLRKPPAQALLLPEEFSITLSYLLEILFPKRRERNFRHVIYYLDAFVFPFLHFY